MSIHAFVTSMLDHWNELLYGHPKVTRSSLPHLQNSAIRALTGARTPLLK